MNVYEWFLGLVTKGHKSFQCCYVQLKPFAPFAHSQLISSLSLSHAHIHTHIHSITQLASLPCWVREIYGEKLCSSSAVFPRGVSHLHLYARHLLDGVKKHAQWSQRIGTSKTSVSPSRIREVAGTGKINSLGGSWLIFISPQLMKMY